MAKTRADKYDEKLQVNLSMDELAKIMLRDPKKVAKKAVTKAKAKK